MTTDFTNPDVFLSYLSAFWSRVFTDSEAVRGLVAGDAQQLGQLQRDFEELVRTSSIADIVPLHTEDLRPIFIRRNTLSSGPGVAAYGDGQTYGPQDGLGRFAAGRIFAYDGNAQLSPAWYHAVDPALRGCAGAILNRPFDPSVIFVEGNEFAFVPDEGIIVFRDNPFDNPLLTRRIVPAADGSGPTEEICLFVLGATLDRGDLQNRYGYAFFPRVPGGVDAESYRRLLEILMRLYSGGPTIAALDAFFAAACGAPLTSEAQETVETVAAQPDGSQVVITDRAVYPVPAGWSLRPTIIPGAILSAGSPLATATAVWDARTAPTAIYAQSGLHAAADFLPAGLRAGLGFPNEPVPVEPGLPIDTDAGEVRSGSFALVGAPRALAAFWDQVRARSVAADTFFADRLWRAQGLVDDESGEPDYTLTPYVNPLEFLYDNFLREGLIGVTLEVAPTAALLAAISRLRETLPAGRALLVFLAPGYADDLALSVDPASGFDPSLCVPPDERAVMHDHDFDSVDLDTRAAFDGANAVANLVGYGQAPGLLVDTLDLSGDVVLNTVQYLSMPDCR